MVVCMCVNICLQQSFSTMDSRPCFQRFVRQMLLLCVVSAMIQGILGLKMIKLDMPEHIVSGQSVLLECLYNLQANEQVYSIKFYKGQDEFYRYVPKEVHKFTVFPLLGVSVNRQNSSDRVVQLDNVQVSSSGIYKCEVSGESPNFTTVSAKKEMTVIDIPDSGPRITGELSKYKIGDKVHVNCTTERSKPAASLEWHINGDKAPSNILHKYPTQVDSDGLETAVLGLEFEVEGRHFSNGDLKLRCSAAIGYVYQKSYDLAVVGEHLRVSQLESKGSPSHIDLGSAAMRLREVPGRYAFLSIAIVLLVR